MHTPSPTVAPRPTPTPRHAFVADIAVLSPAMRRITLEGPDLESFAWTGPAAHVKILFPDAKTGRLPEFSAGRRPATMRTYTPRHFDVQTGQLQIDFVLHGAGVASSWASHAKVGDELVILGPAPGYQLDLTAEWYALICDLTALPAIETLLEALRSAMPMYVFVEAPAADEYRQLSGLSAADVRWFIRTASDPSPLADALERFSWPRGEGRVYVGCESTMMQRIRRTLLAAGLAPAQITTRGYWRIGSENHPDSDYGRGSEVPVQ